MSWGSVISDQKPAFFAQYGDPGCLFDQIPSEFGVLLEAFIKLQPKRIVEIGTHQGGTLYYWLRYAIPGADVISIDVNHTRLENRPERWGFNHVNLHIITADSGKQETFGAVKVIAPHIDFLFIDGLHTFPTVRTDYEWYGGIASMIALHDIGWGRNPNDPPHDVRALWHEIVRAEENTQAIISLPASDQYAYGIGIVRRRCITK